MKEITNEEQMENAKNEYRFKQLDNKLYITDNGEIISIIIEIGDLSKAISLAKCMIRVGFIYPMVSIVELKRLLNDYVKPVFNFSCKKDKVVKMGKKVRRNLRISKLKLFYRTVQLELLKINKRSVNRKPVHRSDSAFELIGCNLNDSFP
jgi:hypothetical protein